MKQSQTELKQSQTRQDEMKVELKLQLTEMERKQDQMKVRQNCFFFVGFNRVQL